MRQAVAAGKVGGDGEDGVDRDEHWRGVPWGGGRVAAKAWGGKLRVDGWEESVMVVQAGGIPACECVRRYEVGRLVALTKPTGL